MATLGAGAFAAAEVAAGATGAAGWPLLLTGVSESPELDTGVSDRLEPDAGAAGVSGAAGESVESDEEALSTEQLLSGMDLAQLCVMPSRQSERCTCCAETASRQPIMSSCIDRHRLITTSMLYARWETACCSSIPKSSIDSNSMSGDSSPAIFHR